MTLSPEQIEHRKAWIEALRSGEYAQTRNQLKRTKWNGPSQPEGYCCLGVACELYPDGYWDQYEWYVFDTPGGRAIQLKTYLKGPVQKYYGLTTHEQNVLVKMNDTQHKSFAEIADYLEGTIAEAT